MISLEKNHSQQYWSDGWTDGWPDEAKQLWQRIQAYAFDTPHAAMPFSRRLARDNNWSAAYAERVIAEYRRFCFLACVSDTPVTPSDQVDQAWHLHLLYTRDYWDRFCPQVLGRALHHGPTLGGAAEGQRFDEQYAQTRHAYLRLFGHHPPADIWPGAEERFCRDTRWMRVNRDDYWLFRKPTPKRRPAPALRNLAVALALMIAFFSLWPGTAAARYADHRPSTLAAAHYNPFALAAGPFLSFYTIACSVVVVGCYLSVRSRSRALGQGRGLDVTHADVYTAAWLFGGRERTLLTAVASLAAAGSIVVTRRHVRAMHRPDAAAHPIDLALYGAVEPTNGLKSETLFNQPPQSVERALRRIQPALEQSGLMVPKAERPVAERIIVILFPLALALPRILMALAHARPIDFLLFLTLMFLGVGALIVFSARSDLTEGGQRLRQRLGAQARSLKSRRRSLDASDLLLGTAVVGSTFLAGTFLDDIRQAEAAAKDSGSSSGGCGGCGGCGG